MILLRFTLYHYYYYDFLYCIIIKSQNVNKIYIGLTGFGLD